MAFVVVTRLRLRDPEFFEDFFAAAVAVVEQATSADGNLGADVLAEANNTYWTRTCWHDEAAMTRFMLAEPHRTTMDQIDEWCDEATFVNWEQASAEVPDWQAGFQRLVRDGSVTSLPHASAAHETRDFPPPVLSDE